jgi:hypothetical protein
MPWLVVCAGLAMCIDLGRFHYMQHGDSLIPVLSSLYQWTTFYWEQDRLGSLLPLLALPIRHPFANLLVQNGLGIFFALASFFLLPRFMLRDRTWPLIGGLGLIAFLGLTPEYYRFTFMAGHQPYFTSLALGLAGLIVAEKAGFWRTAAGLLLLLLSHWVHFGAFTLFIPLVLARRYLLGDEKTVSEVANRRFLESLWRKANPVAEQPDHGSSVAEQPEHGLLKSQTGRQTLLVCISAATGIVLNQVSRYHHADSCYGLLSPSDWLTTWSQMARRSWAQFEGVSGPSWPAVLLTLAATGLVWGLCRRQRSEYSHVIRASLVCAIAAIANALLTGSTTWARKNYFDARYWTASVVVLQAGLVLIAIGPLLSKWYAAITRGLALALIPALFCVTMAKYGFPSISQARNDLDCALGLQTEEIIAAQATHICGDYWDVWPAVYHANLTLYEQGSSHVVWGIALRSAPTRKLWIRCPAERMRIAQSLRPMHPEQAQESYELALKYLQPETPLIEVKRLSTIRILRPAGAGDVSANSGTNRPAQFR